jgi:hypothetical protein
MPGNWKNQDIVASDDMLVMNVFMKIPYLAEELIEKADTQERQYIDIVI